MQITINQSEIEAAIRSHILSQINVKDGHEISISLKATRGEDGTTAIIDITPIAETAAVSLTPVKQAEAEPAQTTAVRQTRKPAAKQAVQPEPEVQVQVEPEPSKEEEPSFEPDEPCQEPRQPAADDAGAPQTDAPAEAQATPAEAEADTPAPTAKPKSLFAGLSRP